MDHVDPASVLRAAVGFQAKIVELSTWDFSWASARTPSSAVIATVATIKSRRVIIEKLSFRAHRVSMAGRKMLSDSGPACGNDGMLAVAAVSIPVSSSAFSGPASFPNTVNLQ